MNYTLITFVVLYLLGTLALGVWAGTRIKNTADFAIAGRRLPLIMVVTTTFATWFGAETVMGIPAKFVQGGLNAVVEDPFGAGTCLILVGLFFATKLYKQNLLTIGDFYRQRYGTRHRGVLLGRHHPELPGLGGGADHGARPGVLGADQRRDVRDHRHDRRHPGGAGLRGDRRLPGRGLDRLHPDDRAGDRHVGHRRLRERPGRRCRPGDRDGQLAGPVQLLARAQLHRHRLLHRRRRSP